MKKWQIIDEQQPVKPRPEPLQQPMKPPPVTKKQQPPKTQPPKTQPKK